VRAADDGPGHEHRRPGHHRGPAADHEHHGTTADTDRRTRPRIPTRRSAPARTAATASSRSARLCDDGNLDNTDACVADCAPRPAATGSWSSGSRLRRRQRGSTATTAPTRASWRPAATGCCTPRRRSAMQGRATATRIYGGCTTLCQLGPRCGDGKVNGPRTATTEPDSTDGCLAGCIEATSCLQILGGAPDAPSGKYRIWPEALGGDIDVVGVVRHGQRRRRLHIPEGRHPDDGRQRQGGGRGRARCARCYGMHLLVTRTEAHVKSAYTRSRRRTTCRRSAAGPRVRATTTWRSWRSTRRCRGDLRGRGLNSVDCPGWRAWDDQAFWVTDAGPRRAERRALRRLLDALQVEHGRHAQELHDVPVGRGRGDLPLPLRRRPTSSERRSGQRSSAEIRRRRRRRSRG
jgi:hypothetical protein